MDVVWRVTLVVSEGVRLIVKAVNFSIRDPVGNTTNDFSVTGLVILDILFWQIEVQDNIETLYAERLDDGPERDEGENSILHD